jgi:uncharacterized protein (DUF488 family)
MSETLQLFTIGFAGKPAARFFELLQIAGVRRVVDVRLNNVSQLAAFAKKDDLRFFLRAIAAIDYVHMPELAPTKDILDAFKKDGGDWAAYELAFCSLLEERRIEDLLTRESLDRACLLCSEDRPEQCHRRLVAEHLQQRWGDVTITHLV